MTEGRTRVKITLSGLLVYFFSAWVGKLAGQDALLGMDFMVPAGIRLDLSHGVLTLPDEVQVQLAGRRPLYGSYTDLVRWDQDLTILVGRSADTPVEKGFRSRNLWLNRSDRWVSTFVKSAGRRDFVRVTNIGDNPLTLDNNTIVGMWLAEGKVPRKMGFVSIGSRRYVEWQNLAYQSTTDLISDDGSVEEDTSPLVERPSYVTPKKMLVRRKVPQSPGSVDHQVGEPRLVNVVSPQDQATAEQETEEGGHEIAKSDHDGIPNQTDISEGQPVDQDQGSSAGPDGLGDIAPEDE